MGKIKVARAFAPAGSEIIYLSWDSNPRQSWACEELGEETQEGFLFSFLLAFESHSKTVVLYLIRVLKLLRI